MLIHIKQWVQIKAFDQETQKMDKDEPIWKLQIFLSPQLQKIYPLFSFISIIQHIIMKTEENLQEKLLQTKYNKSKSFENEPQLTAKQKSLQKQFFSEKHYLNGNNCFQVMFFTWVSPLLEYGYRVPIDEKAIPHLKQNDKPKIDFNRLKNSFQDNCRKHKSKTLGFTLTKSAFKAFKKQFGLIFFFSFIITGLEMYQPILSHDVITYINNQQKTLKIGLLYFLAIFVTTLLISLNTTLLWYYFTILGFNLSNTLSLLIYNKALKHPLITQKEFTVSNIINFSQVDAQRLTYFGLQLTSVLFTPIQIIVGLFLLYWYIGISFLVGLGVMIGLMLFTFVFSKISAKVNDQLLKAKDARMKIAEEILQIIKFIKINALEKYFFEKINVKRDAQLKLIKKVNLLNIITTLIFWISPPMIVAFTFLVYVSIGNEITPAKAFFTIIVFNILQSPIRSLPGAISNIIQIWSSVKRIENFLFATQLNEDYIEAHEQNGQSYAIEIKNGHFLWGKEKKKQGERKEQSETQSTQRASVTKSSKKGKKKGKKKKLPQKEQQSKQSFQSRKSLITVSDANSDENKLKQSITQIQKNLNESSQNQQFIQNEKYTKALFGVNLKIPAKEVTMIIGDIGSGKSSLLYAVLNQMTPEPEKNPKIIINGSIAYSPQKAWIMTGTVKENIVFFQPYDEQRFNDAIHYSCLTEDIKILLNGVDTEIGEKGTNLSGGQKTRISLARALYSNKDIYFLDDILSAVDVHVGKFIMQQTILKFLRGKTIVMPTHAVNYLEKADNIIIMKKGQVVIDGPYKHISDHEEFQQIMATLEKKQKQKLKSKPSKQDQEIVQELKQVKQVKLYKEKSLQKELEFTQGSGTNKITDKIVEQLVMPQDHKKGQVKLQVYAEYIRLNGGTLFVLSIIFCMSCWTTLSVFSNIQIQNWCEDQSKDRLYLYLYLGLAIAAVLFSGIRAYILISCGIRQGRILHKNVIKALLYASIAEFYNRVPIGRILNRLSKDLREIDEVIGFTVGNTLVTFFSMLASLIMCIYASKPYVLIPIVFVSFGCARFLQYYLKSQRECVRLEGITTSPIVSGFTTAINGVSTIRAYGLQKQFINLQIQRIDTNKRMRITRQALESWFALRLTLLSFVINMSALGYSILSDNKDASLAGLLLTYSIMLSDDVINFAFSFASLVLKMIAIERVSTFSKIQAEPGYIQFSNNWNQKQEGSDSQAIVHGSIEFKKYSARYREGLPLALNHISLKIEKGEKVGIVGRTGSGKTTLLNCLIRIIQSTEGHILIDGKDITNYNLKDLRSCITMIEQQPTLMNDTFKQNLDPAHQYTDSQIANMLKDCNLLQFVEEKGGLEAKVTNDNISVGEKQLICICRAFLKRSKIILIDEATANIDVKHDKLIQEVISTVFKDSTVLTIAHRLTTLENCDKILVLGDGKVLEWGPTEELINKEQGIYRHMWEQSDKSYLK